MTPEERDDDALDERYRRASGAAAEAPSEAVRAAILAEGRRVAEQQRRAAGLAQLDTGRPAANDRHWRLAAIGTLLAATIAGLIVVPIYREPPAVPAESPLASTGAPASAVAPATAPAAEPGAAAPASLPPVTPMAALRSKAAPVSREAQSAAPADAMAPAPSAAPLQLPAPARNADAALGSTTLQAEASRAAGGATSHFAADSPQPAELPLTAGRRASAEAAPPRGVSRSAEPALAEMKAADPQATSALRAAVVTGDTASVTALVEAGTSLGPAGEDGRTALLLATVSGQTEVVRVLLAHGADPNVPGRDGRTPLTEARSRHLDTIAALLERAGAH